MTVPDRCLSLSPARLCLVALGLLLFHSLGTWILPLIDRDEPRFAEASREMLERQDYVIPWFNNTYRFDKPPLIYWLQIASFRAFGETEFAARFPSALCAVLTAIALYGWGCRTVGPRAAFWAATLFSLSLQVAIHARAAVADMAMVLFFTLALWMGWEILQGHRKAWLPWVLALALGFLAKGPVAWLALIPFWFSAVVPGSGQPRKWRLVAASVAGLILAAALVLVWAVPALQRTDGEFFRVGIGKHVVHRSLDAFEGHGAEGPLGYLLSLPFFFLTVFLSFFPGSIFLPWLVRTLRDRSQRDAFVMYLLVAVLSVFLVFTFVSTKLPHYTLPAFPPLALLLAHLWLRSDRPVQTLRKWSVVAIVAWTLICIPGALVIQRFFPSPQLLAAARPYLTPEMEFASVQFEEPSLVWYFRKEINGFHRKLKISQVAKYLEQPGPRFAIFPTQEIDKVQTPSIGYRDLRVQGWNIVNGKQMDLTLRIKTTDATP